MAAAAVLGAGVAAATPAGPRLPMGLTTVDGATQVIVVTAPTALSSTASLRAFALTGGAWHEVLGPVRARVGRHGWSAAARRHEGDGTTPEGNFAIGPTVYGVRPNPGVALRFHRLVPGDYWDENPATGAAYNTFRHSADTNCARNPFGGATECLWREAPAYNYFAVIRFNTPATGPFGSGIFLHVTTGSPTAGCVAIPQSTLLRLLRWMRPGAGARIVLAGPTATSRW